MSSYSQSTSDFTELSSDGGRSSVSRTDDGENAGPDLLKVRTHLVLKSLQCSVNNVRLWGARIESI